MALQTLNALNRGDHRIIEAGTGTGKSLAYLLPAAAWAVVNNSRVVIATNTIPLQDQLLDQEMPRVAEVLAITDLGQDSGGLPALRATTLKGVPAISVHAGWPTGWKRPVPAEACLQKVCLPWSCVSLPRYWSGCSTPRPATSANSRFTTGKSKRWWHTSLPMPTSAARNDAMPTGLPANIPTSAATFAISTWMPTARPDRPICSLSTMRCCWPM